MKKRAPYVLIASLTLILISSIFFSTFVFGQDRAIPAIDPETGLPKGMPTDIDDFKNKTETIWDYLQERWEPHLLENKAISAIDSFLKKISVVFLIFFAKPYSLSLVLLGVIVLWFFVFLNSASLISSQGLVGEGLPPYLASLALATTLAWINVFETLIVLFGRLVYSPEHSWTRLLVFILIVLGGAILQGVCTYASKILKKKKENSKKKETDQARKEISAYNKGLQQ